MGYSVARCILRPDASCFRDFRKVQSTRQERRFVWKWKQLGWVHKKGGANIVSQVDKRLKYGTCLPALWRWVSEKEQWPLPALLSGIKLPSPLPLALIPKQFNSSPYIHAFFQAAAPVLDLRESESE